MRHYTTHHRPGTHLTFHDRQTLARDWNERVRRGRMPTLREFARDHGLAPSTWQREFNRGRTGETVPDPERPSRRVYALYDPGKAQDGVNAGHANKGAPTTEANQKGNRKMRMFRLLSKPLQKVFKGVAHFACNLPLRPPPIPHSSDKSPP